ncbi:glycoside hydrolase family 15 protein [Kribbella qitaiheensis]|uniref:Glycoside hydrolase family 15 protein n=1 Tax=Kribbella qitaiheensis TaxID=1544730 RepID=A0A7G6X560_9ACTN|nr:glycoside hydrolase family 15 protein [Kribbella qitaiheensis]QNE21375.1 glycoside hydrolase family 15 protein [Kribbella qitaiheensis]
MSDVPLHRHALLSDCGSAALVTADGSIDWLCLPRFDSPPVLGRLLDDVAGHFLIAPAAGGYTSTWRYLPSSLVLETTWRAVDGELVVTDAMALGAQEHGHELGRSAPGVLLRHVRCTRGSVAVRVEFAPRPEFGLVHPRLTLAPGAVIADGGSQVLMLSTDAHLQIAAGCATGDLILRPGQQVTFALQQWDPWGPSAKVWKPRKIRRRLKATETSWRSWSSLHQAYEGPLRTLVHHSGVVLQALTYARSGAIVAAATTSLPEGVGSGRTWDYRYTWIRDASMTLQGLYVAACPDEAARFFAFLTRAAATQLERGLPLQIMFGVGGERDLSERELSHLSGWRNSGPVRVGNGAWAQQQLDVYGALLDAAYTLRLQLGDLDESTRLFLRSAVNAAAVRWRENDQGIWEFRGQARPFLHSKLMCWVALDRGIRMSDQLSVTAGQLADWILVRDEIRESILARGWSERVGAFTQSFGSDEVDASGLLMAIMGFLPASDPRLLSTIAAIQNSLQDERGLLYRYQGDDGFEQPEGTFLLCTFWLAHALALTGQTEQARDILLRAAGYATDLGLLAEQVDPVSGELLGNFPQAFSHLGLVNAAQALAEAEAAKRTADVGRAGRSRSS